MDNINWDAVQEQQDGRFNRPTPGGYIARIVHVEDAEDKKYLLIEWDFAEGPYKGDNAATASRAGFWPIRLIRSYKPNAQGYFKAFKTSVELSNRGYMFRNDPQSLINKLMGVVLGEEEYTNSKGEIKKRLYVDRVCSTGTIQDGTYTIPELKKLRRESWPTPTKADEDFFQQAGSLTDSDCPF